MNRVILMGRLGADPELKFTQTGVAVASFSMVTSKVWYNDKKEKQESAEWHNIVAWQKNAETICKYFGKGDQILVEGELQTRSWEDKEGNKRYKTEIRLNHFEFGAKSRSNQEPQNEPSVGHNNAGYGADDDIPF